MTCSTRTSSFMVLALLFAGCLIVTPAHAGSGIAGFDTQSYSPMTMTPWIPHYSSGEYWTAPGLVMRVTAIQAFRTYSAPFIPLYGIRPKSWLGQADSRPSPMFASADGSQLDTLKAWSTATSAAPGSVDQVQTGMHKPYEPTFWGKVYGGTQKYQDYGTTAGGTICTFGFAVGAHLVQADEFVLGFLMAYERSTADVAHGLGNGKIETFRFGPYAAKRFGNWFTHAELTAGLHWANYDRKGFGTENKGDFEACDISLSTTVGYDIKVCKSTVVSPFVSLNYTYLSRQGVNETGFVPTRMRFGAMQESILTSQLGVKAYHKTLICGQEAQIGAHGALAHRCHFGNESFSVQSAWGGPVTEQGAVRGPQDFFVYGANVELPITDNSYLTFSYDGMANTGFVSHFASLSYRIAL